MGVRAAVAVLIAVSLSLGPRAQAANPPVLVSLSPPSTVAGAGALTLTVNGANFVNGAGVRVNSVSRPTTFIDSTRVTAQLTAADVQNAGTLQITATIPGSIPSSALSFTVYPNDPQITTLSPSTISVGSAAFILQVNGQNFAPSAVVRVNDTNRTTSFVSSRQLNVAIPATDVDRATTLFITVLNPNLQMSPPSTLPVTTGAPSPSITLLSPNPVGTESSPVTLSVTGANFLSGAVVKANGASRPTTFVDASHLTAQLSTTDIATPTTITITVTNPSGASSGAATLNVIEANTPSILSISPGTVTAGAG
ncbi:MAG: IPT/TIG domain-containing protein, partial [Acidobacteriota bacterium]